MAPKKSKQLQSQTPCSRNWPSPLTQGRSSGVSPTRPETEAVALSSRTPTRGLHRPSQPTLHPGRLDTGLRCLYGIGCHAHEEGQAHPDRQGAGDLHVDDYRSGLPYRQREDWADEQNAMTGAEARHSNAPAAVSASGAISITWPRCGFRSMSTDNRPNSPRSRSGRSQKRARRPRHIRHPVHDLPQCNEVQSIRRRLEGSKASSAFWEAPSTGRSCGELHTRNAQTRFPTLSFRPTLPKRWSEPRVESARRTHWRTRLVRHLSSRSWIDCESSPRKPFPG